MGFRSIPMSRDSCTYFFHSAPALTPLAPSTHLLHQWLKQLHHRECPQAPSIVAGSITPPVMGEDIGSALDQQAGLEGKAVEVGTMATAMECQQSQRANQPIDQPTYRGKAPLRGSNVQKRLLVAGKLQSGQGVTITTSTIEIKHPK